MVETSGRDIGMFEYIDHFFPGDEYNKLLVHFAINDVSFAETSVDRRMEKEMSDGQLALERLKDGSGSTLGIIAANAGGPYVPYPSLHTYLPACLPCVALSAASRKVASLFFSQV